jgi:hypothetical protein
MNPLGLNRSCGIIIFLSSVSRTPTSPCIIRHLAENEIVTVLLILSPHPSLLILLWHHYYKALNSRYLFLAHLLVTYALTFITLSSLMVCVVRDPGPVGFDEAIAADQDGSRRSEDMSLAEALMAPSDSDDSDFNSPAKWCKACWAPKPARAHHCSHCGRCVLRMGMHVFQALFLPM